MMTQSVKISFQGFSVRAFVLPDEEFRCLDLDLDLDLEDIMCRWEKAFHAAFGTAEMVYNVHLWVRK